MNEQTQTDSERQRKTFRKWYGENGEDLNAKRRERYANDPEYRAKAKEQARRARERRKARGGVAETHVTREVDGKEVTMFRVSAAAEMIGTTPDTIRRWCRKGYVPAAEEGTHRLYTRNQIKLLATLDQTIREYRYDPNYKKILKACVKHIAAKW